MTIGTTTVATSGSTGNGATVTFTFSFPIADYGAVDAEDQVQVLLETIATGARSLLTRGTSAGQYSVSINGDQSASPGGSITTVTTYSSSYRIWIRSAPSFLQATDLSANTAFNAQTIEDQLDQMQRQILILRDRLRRAPVFDTPAGASFDGEITGPFTVGYALTVNGAGTGWTLSSSIAAGAISATMAAFCNAGSIGAANTALGLGTGDTPTFAGTLVSGTSPTLEVRGSASAFQLWQDSGASTNEKRWYRSVDGTTLTEYIANDANNASTSWLTVVRSAHTSITSILFGGPLGVTGAMAATGAVTSASPTAGMGYATGAGGTVTQITSRATGVTLSKTSGAITTDTTSLAAEASATFTVTNTTVAATDTIVLSIKSGANGGNTAVNVVAVAAGSFDIKVSNNNAAAGTAETGAIVINFAVLKAVAA